MLTGCSLSEPALAIGESAPLTSDTLEASLTVTAVTASDFATLGLEGALGSDLPDGVPWVVDYRIDLASGTRADFSWDAVPTLTSGAWSGRTDNRSEVQATMVSGGGTMDWCPGYVAENPDTVVGTYCQVYVVPEGQELVEVQVQDVGTWETSTE